MLDWLKDNVNWVFSGIGVPVVVGFFSWLFHKNRKKQRSQNQQVGDNSTAIQVGRDFKVGGPDDKK